MSYYEYTLIDIKNHIHRGVLRSWSKKSAQNRLKVPGYSLVTLGRVKSRVSLWQSIFRHISRMDRIVFTRNLMTMMRAGMNLVEALSSAREQSTNPKMRQVMAEAQTMVLSGQPLSAALARHAYAFSPVYLAMIRIGERSGRLVETLQYLTEQQESDLKLLRKIRNAMVYPTMIITTMVAMVALMMIFVIPKIAQIYSASQVSLPFYTAVLIDTSNFIAKNVIFIVLALVFMVLLWRLLLLKSFRFRKVIHNTLINLPLVGEIIKKVNLASAARSLAMLTQAGMSIDESLVLASGTTKNVAYQQALYAAEPFVKRGVSLADIFRGNDKLFLPLFQKMVMTGEATGNLDDMFGHVAKYYDEDIEHWTGNMSTLIEPVLLVGTGMVVGGVALAVIFPLWNFANII